ncbi:MAG: glycosyltransferase family 39 protein [Anaerolineae bacterium]|nr:glycosyltransferase family 39 protein [Anaerolineae bacterium]
MKDRISGLLLLIGLTFAFLGQFYFFRRREYVWDGLLLWGIAIYAFVLLLFRLRREERGHHRRRFSFWEHGTPLRWLGLCGGIWLSLWAGWLARRSPPGADFSLPLWMWLVGVWSFLAALVPGKPAWLELFRSLRAHRGEIALLIALVAFALAIRAFDLEHIPANLGGDEGTQGAAAMALLGPPLGNPFATGWFGVPTMSFFAYGLSIRLFGATIAGLRALSALIGAATVLVVFLLARELWGPRVAWPGALLLAVSHYHIHFSRLGSNQIADGLFMALALFFLVRGLRSRGRENGRSRAAASGHSGAAMSGRSVAASLQFALAGVVIGLGWYGYFGARMVGLVAACYLIWRAWVTPRFKERYGREVLIMVLAASVVVAPLMLYYAAHPAELASRSHQVSIFASGWLEQEQQITGRSAFSLLLQQFWKSISAFNYTLDPTFWYRPEIPLLDFISGILFIPGLVWAMAHWRRPANGLLLLWFWLALILGWVVTENPPSSQRMTIIMPAVALLGSLGLNWLAELIRRLFAMGERPLYAGMAVVLAFIAVLNLRYYFAVYTPKRVYGNPTAELATELARYLTREGKTCTVYFYGQPFIYWDFGTLAYMLRDVRGIDVPPGSLPPGRGEVEGGLPPGRGEPEGGLCFVFVQERLSEFDNLRREYPGGKETTVYSEVDGRPLFLLYEVDGSGDSHLQR